MQVTDSRKICGHLKMKNVAKVVSVILSEGFLVSLAS